jgi:hypothetical protein
MRSLKLKQDFVEPPTDDKVSRRPQRAETGRSAWAAVGQERKGGKISTPSRARDKAGETLECNTAWETDARNGKTHTGGKTQ